MKKITAFLLAILMILTSFPAALASSGMFAEEVSPACPHMNTSTFYRNITATCTESGTMDKVTVCEDCHQELSVETVPSEALGHVWNDGEVIVSATCTTAGSKKYTCTRTGCGATQIEEIAPREHSIRIRYICPSTCCEQGFEELFCVWCFSLLYDQDAPIDPNNHADYGTKDVVTKEATCKETGSKNIVCLGCGAVLETVSIDKNPDNHADYGTEEVVTKEATCKETGSKNIVCKGCGVVFETVSIDKNPDNHADYGTYSSPIEETRIPSTCTQKGSFRGNIICNGCKAIIEEKTFSTVALGHDWVYGVQYDPNCTEKGYTQYTCSRCPETTKENYIPALGHNFKGAETVLSEASCTEVGYKTIECTRCEETTKVEIPAHGHDMIATPEKAADCYNKGNNKYYTCNICKKVFKDINGATPTTVEAEILPPVEHKWNAGEIVFPSTCTEIGEKKLTCQRCNATKTEIIPALGHNIVEDAAVAPTCTKAGKTAGKHCTRCDYKVAQTTVAKLGHNIVKEAAVEPTCTKSGKTEGEHCTRCDYKKEQETVAKLGHNYVIDAAVAATCTETGLTEGKHCTRCDSKVAQVTVSALGHDIVEDAAVEPTCTKSGKTEGEHCTRCDYKKEQETVAKLGHNIVKDAAVAPTCTEPGKTEGEHCTRCDYKKEQTKILALGHDIVKDEAVAPTCTKSGKTEGEHCTRCDYKKEQTKIPALGHDIVKDAAVEPTCTKSGKTEGEHCTRCDYKKEQETVAKLGHDIVKDAAVEPTCTKSGKKEGEHCTRCDYKKEQTKIDALGHDLTKVSKKEATCSAEGNNTYYKCSRCEKLFADKDGETSTTKEKVTVAKKAHTYGEPVFKPTGADSGNVVFTCSVCKHKGEVTAQLTSSNTATCTEDGEKIIKWTAEFEGKKYSGEMKVAAQKLGHDFKEYIPDGDETCTEDGHQTATCSRCGATDKKVLEGSKKGHSFKSYKAKAATCTASGYTAYKKCAACGEIEGKETVKALGHSYTSKWTWTGTTKAVRTATCSRCDDKKTATALASKKQITSKTTKATCAAAGKTVYTAKVTVDGKTYSKTKTVSIAKTAHKYGSPKWTWNSAKTSAKLTLTCSVCKKTTTGSGKITTKVTTKATSSKNGKVTYTAKATFNKKSYTSTKTATVYKLGTVKLSETSIVWTGKTEKPTVTVKDSKGKTVASENYTVKYSSSTSKNPGKYTVTVTFKNKYSGTKTLSYTIKLAKPVLTVSGNKVSWKAVPGAKQYKIYVGGKLFKTVTAKSYTFSCKNGTGKKSVYVIAVRDSAKSEKSAAKTVNVKHDWSETSNACTECEKEDPIVKYSGLEMIPNEYTVGEEYHSELILTVRCKEHKYTMISTNKPAAFSTAKAGEYTISMSFPGKVLSCKYYVLSK